MARSNSNSSVSFHEIRGADHFSILAPVNELMARKILQDKQGQCSISLSTAEVEEAIASKR